MFKKKKYSAKVTAQAESWLEQFDTSLESLTPDQQEVVLKHTRLSRARKWLWIVILAGIFYLGAGIYGYFLSIDLIQSEILDPVITACDSEHISLAANVIYFLCSITFAYFLAGLFQFYSVWVDYLYCSRNRKIIEAFLRKPA